MEINKDNLRDEFNDYLLLKELSERTINEYLRYFKYLEIKSDLQESINTFLLKNRNGMARAFVKNFLEFLNIRDIDIPKATGRKKKRVIQVLSDNERKALQEYLYIKRKMFGIMFELQYTCGLRSSELINLKLSNFGINEWIEDPSQPCKLLILGKGNKERIVFVHPRLMKKILDFSKHRIAIMEEDEIEPKFFKIGDRYWRSILEKASEDLKIEKRVYPHLLRHTITTNLKKNKMDLIDIKNFLGHSSLSTTERYINLSPEESQKKMKEYISNLE